MLTPDAQEACALLQECCGWDVAVVMHCCEMRPPQALQVRSFHCRAVSCPTAARTQCVAPMLSACEATWVRGMTAGRIQAAAHQGSDPVM